MVWLLSWIVEPLPLGVNGGRHGVPGEQGTETSFFRGARGRVRWKQTGQLPHHALSGLEERLSKSPRHRTLELRGFHLPQPDTGHEDGFCHHPSGSRHEAK